MFQFETRLPRCTLSCVQGLVTEVTPRGVSRRDTAWRYRDR
jgi:hypothetical protein